MNKKNVILIVVSFIIGMLLGGILVYLFLNEDKTNDKVYEDSIQKSTYTLEEIYEIVENPKKFKELNQGVNDFNYMLCNFYKFFSKETPFKVVTKLNKNNNGELEVIEVKYLTYGEYLDANKEYLDMYEIQKKLCDESKDDETWEHSCNDPKYGIRNMMYSVYAEQVVYGNLISINS